MYKDKKFIFTGFRNKDYEKIIIENGYKVVTSISKSTHIRRKYFNTFLTKILLMKSINVSLKSIFARGNPITITTGETGLGLIVLGLYVPDQVALGRRGLGT